LTVRPLQQHEIISWRRFHDDTLLLAGKLTQLTHLTTIVAITRGGLVPAAIIARELNIRFIDTIGVKSYEDNKRRGEMMITKGLSSELLAQSFDHIVIVDDLADTGRTAQVVRAMLPGAYLATPYVKPEGAVYVDYYACQYPQDVWLVFPWDVDQLLQDKKPETSVF
jgi:xanthine phosphoribosyltransferase